MFLRRTLLTISMLLVFTMASYSQYLTGNGRLIHTHNSDLKRVSTYDVSLLSGNSMIFGTLDPDLKSNLILTQNNFLIDLSITDNAQVSAGFNIFRSTYAPATSEYNVGPVSLALKFGNLAFMQDQLKVGFIVSGSFDIKGKKNVPYYPYNSGALETGVMVYGSYFFDGKIPDQSESIHLNLSLYNHGDKDVNISSGTLENVIKTRSVGIKYSLGYNMPKGAWTFIGETWGEMFVRNPDPIIYSRESFSYISGGVKYDLQWAKFEASADLLVIGYTDETDYTNGVQYGYGTILKGSQTNYAPFYINFGLNFPLSKIINTWNGDAPPSFYYTTTAPKDYTEDLRKEDVITMIEFNYYKGLYECYKGALRFDEKLAGTVYFDFTINEKGVVENVKVITSTFDSVYSQQVEDCMIDKIKAWTFPEGASPIRFEILPLNFGGGK